MLMEARAEASPGSTMLCPSCQTLQPRADRCPACGAHIETSDSGRAAPPEDQLKPSSIGAAVVAAGAGAAA